jgi:hypothetical protein
MNAWGNPMISDCFGQKRHGDITLLPEGVILVFEDPFFMRRGSKEMLDFVSVRVVN